MKSESLRVKVVSNPAIEKRLDWITNIMLNLDGDDLDYFIGYWDGFAGKSKDTDWNNMAPYEMGYLDGKGDRENYKGLVP